MVDDEVGNEGLDSHDDIVAYGDDRSCADYKRALRDELCVKNNKNEYTIVCLFFLRFKTLVGYQSYFC